MSLTPVTNTIAYENSPGGVLSPIPPVLSTKQVRFYLSSTLSSMQSIEGIRCRPIILHILNEGPAISLEPFTYLPIGYSSEGMGKTE